MIGRLEVTDGAEEGEGVAASESVVAVGETEAEVKSMRGGLWGSGEPVGVVVLSDSEDTVIG